MLSVQFGAFQRGDFVLDAALHDKAVLGAVDIHKDTNNINRKEEASWLAKLDLHGDSFGLEDWC